MPRQPTSQQQCARRKRKETRGDTESGSQGVDKLRGGEVFFVPHKVDAFSSRLNVYTTKEGIDQVADKD